MLLTEADALKTLCPYRGSDCLAKNCFVFRTSKLVDRRDGKRLYFCGTGGQAGAWNPWAANARDVKRDDNQTGNSADPPTPDSKPDII